MLHIVFEIIFGHEGEVCLCSEFWYFHENVTFTPL